MLTAVDAALPTVIVLADEPVPTLIAPVSVASPILIAPPVEFIEIVLVVSTANVVAPLKEVTPEPAIIKLAVPSVRVSASTDVNVIAWAFVLTAVDAALPTVIVLADEPVPTLIAPAFASSPILMAPPVEFIEIAPEPLISSVLPSNVNAPELIST